MLINSTNFDSDTNSFHLESKEELYLDLEIIDIKHLSTQIKFDYYFNNKNTEINFHKHRIFNVIYPKTISLFTLLEKENNEETFLRRKRSKIRETRKEDLDNVLKKIKTNFFNSALFKAINSKLKSIRSRLNFERFPQRLVSDPNKERNKALFNMTLLEIIGKKELYDEKNLKKYYHNLKVIESEDVQCNNEFIIILNKKYCELFEEYINSIEFIKEIEKLKEKKMKDDYIQKYITAAKHFIEHLSGN